MTESKKPQKGEYGYLGRKKKEAVLHTFLMVAVGLGIFALGLLLNKMEVANIFTVFAFLFVLPAAKAFVNIVVLFPYKQSTEIECEKLFAYAKENDKVLVDVVFTSSERVMHLDCIYITEHQIIGYTSREKDDLTKIEEYFKKELEIRQMSYKVFITSSEKELADRMKLRGEEKDIDVNLQEEVEKLLKVFVV